MTVKKKPGAKKSPQAKRAAQKKSAASKSKSSPEVDEIIAQIMAGIVHPKPEEEINETPKINLNLNLSLPKKSFSKIKFTTPRKKLRSPVIILLVIVLAGFWGRDIVKFLGFPIEPAPFTALYFDDPHITETGIAVGSKVIFGIKNGSFERRTFEWRARISDRKISGGSVTIEPNTERKLSVGIKVASPGDFLEISVDKLKTPIAVVVTG
jgi:hypothetical protein